MIKEIVSFKCVLLGELMNLLGFLPGSQIIQSQLYHQNPQWSMDGDSRKLHPQNSLPKLQAAPQNRVSSYSGCCFVLIEAQDRAMRILWFLKLVHPISSLSLMLPLPLSRRECFNLEEMAIQQWLHSWRGILLCSCSIVRIMNLQF